MEFDLETGIPVLRRTPDVLRSLLLPLPDAWIHGDEGPETWSPKNVVGHLIDGEETDWIPRARLILAQGPHRRFHPFDRFRHLQEERVRQPLSEQLDRFAELRRDNLEALDAMGLTTSDLALEGEHPEFGVVTLSQLLATWVAHDLGHIAQITRVMAKQYREAVGPWEAYLSVLRR